MGQIAKKFKISTSTIWIIKKKEETGSVVNWKQSEHQRITSVTEELLPLVKEIDY